MTSAYHHEAPFPLYLSFFPFSSGMMLNPALSREIFFISYCIQKKREDKPFIFIFREMLGVFLIFFMNDSRTSTF
ncbi:hypothetical protein EXD81_17110 [Bacillus amyloliquefaciens]|nr:hypothetical protein AC810_10465 [Bacillus velezensis]KOC26873.1 hypothetical protein AC811_10810 [Bacillus velezensis]NIH49965.1 hypothetical protein [Bacillus velezensis]QEK98622.1 hypothetical protein EXD81_17110 [Bacillus amyloliquefaciens]